MQTIDAKIAVAKKAAEFITDMIYPPVCIICGSALNMNERKKAVKIHDCCEKSAALINEPLCAVCGKQLGIGEDVCGDCRDASHIFTQSVALFEYNDAVKESICRFKYKNKKEYASSFARALINRYYDLFRLWSPDVIMSVPMHERKRKVRGYNQAQLLANETGKLLNIKTDNDFLIRTGRTEPMKELGNYERRANLKGVFKASGRIDGKKVLLIDDIYTTGATFDACAAELKKSGASKVYGAVLCIGNGF